MKKYGNIFISLILFVIPLVAQDFDGAKIYINPGHGGNNPANDRYIPLTGFWESESNLTKGLHLRELLEAHNAVVFMSRTQNRDEDDLPLSQISADANANNVVYFHSIHSNAFNATINYPLLLFRGYDNAPVFAEAKEMGRIMWNKMNETDNQWTDWSYNWVNNRGDWDFYGSTSGLGVLRGLNMPGTLSEGTFHDYIPNSFRLMSDNYRKHESIIILRSFVEFFDLGQLPTGVIAGIVRDPNKDVEYSYNYNSGLPNDKKYTINNAKVTLLPDNIEYNVDYHKNGFFMFENVAPGSYQVVFDAGQYNADTVSLAAVANRTVFANGFLQATPNKPPQIYGHFPLANDLEVSTDSDIQLLFSQPMDEPSVENGIEIEPSINADYNWQNDSQILTLNLLDTLKRSTEYFVTLGSSIKNKSGIFIESDSLYRFTTEQRHNAPQITSYSPPASMDSVIIYSNIKITFDVEMRPSETEEAFSIEPEIEGTLEWNESFTVLTFNPTESFARSTQYLVKLSTQAQNFLGAPLDTTFEFSFLTRQRNELGIVRSFPSQNQIDVSTRPQFHFTFSGVIPHANILGNYQIKDSKGNLVAAKSLIVSEKDGRGLVVMETRLVLKKKETYSIAFNPGIKDNNGLVLVDTAKVSFTTEEEIYDSGTIVDDFEVLFGWGDPFSSVTSTGLVELGTGYSQSSQKRISSTYSGKLKYEFSDDSAGVCRLENEERIAITSDPLSEFGIWIFGDFSSNIIELWFDDDSQSNIIGYRDSLNWAGWKLIRFPVSQIGAQGNIVLNSVVVYQTPTGYNAGTIYLDDIQYDVQVTAIDDNLSFVNKPQEFQLYQNYPNPFNPVTKIKYYLPSAGKVKLDIFNVIGQKVATLTDQKQAPGFQEISWNAAGHSSGVYFYRLQFNNNSYIRKLILMK